MHLLRVQPELAQGWTFETVVVQTTGDRLSQLPIEQIGGQGAFVKEVSRAVLDGRADVAVHSAKDLPSSLDDGLLLAAVPESRDPRDALVGKSLDDLPAGTTVATGSPRRRAQLAWLRPDLTFCELRGNMRRRIERGEQVGAGVVALAALERLDLVSRVSDVLASSVVLPQVGQGKIALECRESDTETRSLLELVDLPDAHRDLLAERAFLETLGGGCSLPCGALATHPSRDGVRSKEGVVIEGMIASRDGHVLLRRRATGSDPQELGRRLAAEIFSSGGQLLGDWTDDGTGR